MSENKITERHVKDTVQQVDWLKPLGNPKMTICVMTLRNGNSVVGISACVDPANYDENIGRQIASKKALDKIYELEGYLLAQRMMEEKVA